MKYHTREERIRREAKREKIGLVLLRSFCGIVSFAIVVGLVSFVTGEGIKELTEDPQNRVARVVLMLLALLFMTTTIAIKGDKLLDTFQNHFKERD